MASKKMGGFPRGTLPTNLRGQGKSEYMVGEREVTPMREEAREGGKSTLEIRY